MAGVHKITKSVLAGLFGLVALVTLAAPSFVFADNYGAGNYGANTYGSSITPDTTPPTVSLTIPAANATVSGTTVALSATASDNVALQSVKFYVDNVLLGASSSGSSPYTYTWNSTVSPNGTHSIIAVAEDTSNNYATSTAVSVTVANALPVVSSISSGTPSATGATVTWTTNIPTTSQITYGTTTSYTSSTTRDMTLVTSHAQTLTGLTASTTYHYKIYSVDSQGNTASSTDQIFMTSVAQASSSPSQPAYSAGGSGSTQITLPVPSTVTATSTSSAGVVAALQAELLQLIAELKAAGITVPASVVALAGPGTGSPSPSTTFTRDLQLGSTGSDVQALQRLLNANGFTVAASGVGSPGKETTYFGAATKSALARMQKAYKITPAQGYFGAITRSVLSQKGLI